jgi:hypothetical protein
LRVAGRFPTFGVWWEFRVLHRVDSNLLVHIVRACGHAAEGEQSESFMSLSGHFIDQSVQGGEGEGEAFFAIENAYETAKTR